MELRGWVHALSHYTPKFADVYTVPAEDKVVDVVMAAKVISDKAIPIITNVAVISLRTTFVTQVNPLNRKSGN